MRKEFKYSHSQLSQFEVASLGHIIYITSFNEKAAKEFSKDFNTAHESPQPIIPIVIDSYGGQVYSLLSMLALIESSEKPVATIAVGKSMSCGAILLSSGTENYRYMDPNATIMIHDVSSISFGKTEEIKADAKESDRLNQILITKMAKNCGQPKDYFFDLIHTNHHADWYFDAKEAKKHNLINHIKLPKLEVTLSIDYNLK